MARIQSQQIEVELTHTVEYDGESYGPGEVMIPRALAMGLGFLPVPEREVVYPPLNAFGGDAADRIQTAEVAQWQAEQERDLALSENQRLTSENELLREQIEKASAGLPPVAAAPEVAAPEVAELIEPVVSEEGK